MIKFLARINWPLILTLLLIVAAVFLGVCGIPGATEIALAGVAFAILLQT